MTNHALGIDHQHGWLRCPACGYKVDGSAALDPLGNDRAPVDDDLSVCLACASVSVFTNGATRLRPPTVDERGEFARNAKVQIATQALIETRDRADSWPKGPRAGGHPGR